MRIPISLVLVGALLEFSSGCKSRSEAKSDSTEPAFVDAAKPPCAELSERMCNHFGRGSDMCAFVEQQARRFTTENCRSKLREFEQNVAELSKYREARRLVAQPNQKSWNSDAPTLGPDSALVVFTVFCDFESPDCARLSPLHTFVKNLHADQVRLVFHQFPLAKHEHARLAAEAVLAAHAQGKFWEYHDVLFNNTQDLSRPALERYAKTVGLKLPDFKRALDDHTYAADVDADKELGQSLFISELPAVFANGRSVPVPYGGVELARVIDETIAKRQSAPK